MGHLYNSSVMSLFYVHTLHRLGDDENRIVPNQPQAAISIKINNFLVYCIVLLNRMLAVLLILGPSKGGYISTY